MGAQTNYVRSESKMKQTANARFAIKGWDEKPYHSHELA